MKRKVPKWINEYINSIHRLFRGMDLRTLEPLDCFHFHPLHSDLWQDYIYRAIKLCQQKKIPFEKILKSTPNPSSIRAIIQFMVCHYNNIVISKKPVDKKAIKETFNFFVKILKAKNKKDIFCYRENIGHSKDEIIKILKGMKWSPGSREASKEIGRLYLGASSLVNGLMNDWCTDNGIEVWGPYDVSKYCGQGTILVIRDFPRLKPVELWPHTRQYKYQQIKIYTIYKNVDMRVEYIGCHTVFRGNLAEGLIKYALIADGRYVKNIKQMKKISSNFIQQASRQYQRVMKMDFEALKQKVIAQELYQLKDFFQLVGMDYAPHSIFRERLKGKKLLKGRYPLDTTGMSLKEINRRFGIDNLKKLYTE